MSTDNPVDIGIEQDHDKGPGWFLKISYIVVLSFMAYYFVTYKNWKSSYEVYNDKIQQELKSK